LSFNLIHQLTANPKTPKNLKKYKIFETSLTQILGRFPKTIELPSFIRFLRPNVPILSQKLSSFSLLFGVLGDLGRGDAIFQENSYRNLSEFIFSSLHLIFYFFFVVLNMIVSELLKLLRVCFLWDLLFG
jgi:hypothetical protein